MKHGTYIEIPYLHERPLPPFDEGNDIRYPAALVRHFFKKYTKPGDRIFDPFAGLGTTLFTAEEMRRIPFGVEADRQRYEWVAGQMRHWTNLIHGDTGKLASYGLPRMDFSMTSPPYMPRRHEWNPLYGGDPRKAGYDCYLKRLGHIYRQVARLMRKDAYVVIQADNLHHGPAYTPLVRDISNAVSKIMRLEDEVIIGWKNAKPDYPYTHCLLFKKI